MSNFWSDKWTQLQQQYVVARDVSVAEKISAEIKDLESGIKRRLIKNAPFEEHRTVLVAAQEDFRDGQGVYDIRSIKSDFSSYGKLYAQNPVGMDKSFWIRKIREVASKQRNLNKRREIADKSQPSDEINSAMQSDEELLRVDRETCRRHLQKRWQKALDEKYAQWELDTIEKWRQELLQKFQNWLELMQQLADTLSQLSIEPGVLFDLSKDNLSLDDVEAIKRWATYLAHNEGVRQLCEMLGRLRIAARAKREEWIRTTKTIATVVPDTHSREEIIGVTSGKDIEHALPQELALLADDDTSLLFDIKFAEGRLMHFDMAGRKSVSTETPHDALETVDDDEKMGPIIVCVDTSGSMAGQPETIAKAVALYMATKAISQKRNCYLINFSTGIDVLDLSGHFNIKNLIGFLQQSFHGGTDVEPAVEQALSVMEEKDYEKSDLLIISDFVMRGLPDEQRAKIGEFKQKENKFYSLSIGEMRAETHNKGIFDGEWVYDHRNSNIRQLLDIVADEVAAR